MGHTPNLPFSTNATSVVCTRSCFSRACRFADVQIIEVGHEPFCRQDVGRVLLLSKQVVLSQLRRDGLEPLLVHQEEEETRKVLLAAAIHRFFLETIL